MKSIPKLENGFTLIEIMISSFIFVLVWMAIATSFIAVRSLGSYSKHKVQAIYVAQRILEEQRRQPFANLVSQASAPVTIDTMATFSTTADDFMGNRIITVTNIDTYRKRIQVEVNWTEFISRVAIVMREYCTTDIADEPQLN